VRKWVKANGLAALPLTGLARKVLRQMRLLPQAPVAQSLRPATKNAENPRFL
jgi:hypothetical protein